MALRIGLSVVMISHPGLQQDETLFVNAATLRIPGQNITHAIDGIPLMIFPYTGALKSWLYTPVFAIFGTSPASIRLPVILLASAGLVLLYVAVRDLINRPVALLAFVVLCFDNSLFWLTRDDVGPSAIEWFLKCAAVYCASRFARAPTPRWVVLLLATLALGVFNKLNFIWIANAAVVVSLIVIAMHRRSIRAQVRTLAMWAIGLGVIYTCFSLYYFGEHIHNVAAPSYHGNLLSFTWPRFDIGTRGVLSGTWFYGYALAPLGPRNLVVWVVLILFGVGAVASVVPRRTRSMPVAALALTTVLIAIQNLLTSEATAGWHYIAIYPFIMVVAAYGAYSAALALLRRQGAVHFGLACIAAVALAYDGLLMSKYFRALSSREPSSSAWSPAIYQLSRELHRTGARIFTVDWGISNPLFALHPSRRYIDLTFALTGPTAVSREQVGRSLAAIPGAKLLVTHATEKLVFRGANANLFDATGSHLHLVRTIAGRDRRPVYEIYTYRR